MHWQALSASFRRLREQTKELAHHLLSETTHFTHFLLPLSSVMPPSFTPLSGATQDNVTYVNAERPRFHPTLDNRQANLPRTVSPNTRHDNDRTLPEHDAKVQANNVPTPIPASAAPSSLPTRTELTVTPTWDTATVSAMPQSTHDPGLVNDPGQHAPSTTTVYVYPGGSTFGSSINMSSHPTSPLILEPSHSAAGSASSTSVHMLGHIPFYVVILVAVGGLGGLLAVIGILTRCCNRNKRKSIPRPSRPILQESPLFGGKERFSRGIWGDPSFNNLLSTHKEDGWRPLSGGRSLFSEKGAKDEPPSPYLNVNHSVCRPFSPSSIYTTAAPSTQDIGIALEFPVPPLTKVTSNDTQPLNVRNKPSDSKAARRRSRASSVYFGPPETSPTITETETAIAFQTPRRVPTPALPKPVLKNANATRAQVPTRKAAPLDQPVITVQRTPSNSRRNQKGDEPFEYALTTVKSAERRDRDTKALTSALGLASPTQPASCFSPVSLYPDDSLSVVHGRGGRPISDAPPSEMPSPTGTNAALGSFMLQEYPSNQTLASMTGRAKDRLSYILDPFVGGPAETPVMKKSGSKSAKLGSDRPPRVPSPPTLPSLAQMALGNADPDYRSPTYSIYGLYEAQRKSKASISGI